MPPKGSKKPKAQQEAQPALETKPKNETKPKPSSKPSGGTPKKIKEPIVTTSLAHGEEPISVDVTFHGESTQAALNKRGEYVHTLKLTAPFAFTLQRTTQLDTGEHAGLQAILLRPARPFPFLQLPDEARNRVYKEYFAPNGIRNASLNIEARRTKGNSKDMYAKGYAGGSQNRVALLAVNKEVHGEAVQIFYANRLTLESTTTLSDFLVQLTSAVRAKLTNVAIKHYVKTTSRNAMMLLGEGGNVRSLHIESGVSSDKDPGKAAKQFWADAYKFLEAAGAVRGCKDAGIDAVSFGPKALQFKDEKKGVVAWDKLAVEEFRDELRNKMK